MTAAPGTAAPGVEPHRPISRAVRTFAALSVAGALAGAVIGGVGGRLAMSALAHLNPSARGVTSDDGFVMGQVHLDTSLFLVFVASTLGVLGAGIFLCVRGLMIGPRWFRLLSISLGPAVVVGNLLVHTDGVDFQLLHPTVVAIGMFVALPGLYALALALLAERWDAANSWFHRAPLWQVRATLLVWLLAFPVLPLAVVLVTLWCLREAAQSWPAACAVLRHPAPAWTARGGLAVAFAFSAVSLGSKVQTLT